MKKGRNMAVDVKVSDAPNDQMMVTLRGKADEIVSVLVNGLHEESIQQLRNAVEVELQRRRQLAASQTGGTR